MWHRTHTQTAAAAAARDGEAHTDTCSMATCSSVRHAQHCVYTVTMRRPHTHSLSAATSHASNNNANINTDNTNDNNTASDTASAASTGTVVYQGTHTSCKVTGLQPCTEYEFEVRGQITYTPHDSHDRNSDGDSDNHRDGVGGVGVVVEVVCDEVARLTTLEAGPPPPPRFTDVDADVGVSCEGMRVTHTHSSNGQRYAMSDALDLSKGVVWWKVKVHVLGAGQWMLIGIISNNTAGHSSYASKSCFAWDYCSYQRHDGVYSSCPNSTFQQGDEAVLKLVCHSNTLSMRIKRTGAVHSMPITAALQWRIHINLYKCGDSVEVMCVTQEDMF